jgi:hypothetical protein
LTKPSDTVPLDRSGGAAGAARRATPRQPTLLKHWQIPDDLFLEPMDEEDLRAAEGADTDEYGISVPRLK